MTGEHLLDAATGPPPEKVSASVSPQTMARLALLHYLYTVGLEQSQQPEPLAAMSILSFHDSADLFMQLAAEQSGAKLTDKNIYLVQYFTPINNAIDPDRLFHQQAMIRLNEARNAVKHRGSLPSRRDVEQLRADVTRFLEDNTLLIFGIEFSAISMVNLVTYEPARQSLQKAEAHLASGNRKDAQVASAIAFAQLIRDYELGSTTRYGRSPFDFGESFAFERSFTGSGDTGSNWQSFSRDDKLMNTVAALQEAMKILGLGIDYRRYTKFRLLTPVVFMFPGGPNYEVQILPDVPGGPSWPPPLEACRFCFDFVIDTAIRLQDFDLNLDEE